MDTPQIQPERLAHIHPGGFEHGGEAVAFGQRHGLPIRFRNPDKEFSGD